MRIAQIVTAELAKDKMMLEEQLERVINSDEDIYVKLSLIKSTLKEIVVVESMYMKWNNYISSMRANLSNENNGQTGQEVQ